MGLKTTNPLRVTLSDYDGAPLLNDLFAQIRVVNPHPVCDLVNHYGIDTQQYGQQLVGGGTIVHVPTMSSIRLAVTGASGDSAELRTHEYFRYHSGFASRPRISMTLPDAGITNQTREWGYGDDDNGLFFQQFGAVFRVVVRSDTSGPPSDTGIPQASWNVDKMDGSGPSGLTLNPLISNIYEVAFKWLGTGPVVFIINNRIVHVFQNTGGGPYIRQGQLPLRWKIMNSAAASAGSMDFCCAGVTADGASEGHGATYSVQNTADKTIGTTSTPLLLIRPRLTFNSITNRMQMIPVRMSISTTSGKCRWRVVWNPTSITGAVWGDVLTADSAMEYDVTATAASGGTTLMSGYLPNNIDSDSLELSRVFRDVPRGRKLTLDAFGSIQNTLGIFVTADSSTVPVRAAITWEELR